MGTWVSNSTIAEWESFSAKAWGKGAPVPVEQYEKVRGSWFDGYEYGFNLKEIEDGDTLQGRED